MSPLHSCLRQLLWDLSTFAPTKCRQKLFIHWTNTKYQIPHENVFEQLHFDTYLSHSTIIISSLPTCNDIIANRQSAQMETHFNIFTSVIAENMVKALRQNLMQNGILCWAIVNWISLLNDCSIQAFKQLSIRILSKTRNFIYVCSWDLMRTVNQPQKGKFHPFDYYNRIFHCVSRLSFMEKDNILAMQTKNKKKKQTQKIK